MNTNLLTTVSFGLKRHFKKFRKHLRREALDFKFGNKHTHRNPHAIPFDLKRKLQNVNILNNHSLVPHKIGLKFVNYKEKASNHSENSPKEVSNSIKKKFHFMIFPILMDLNSNHT